MSALLFSPDGRWLVAGTGQHSPRLWRLDDLAAPGEPRVLTDGTPIVTARFVLEDRWIASGDLHGRIRLWDLIRPASTSRLPRSPGLGEPTIQLSVGPDSRFLLVHHHASGLALWKLAADGTAEEVALLPGGSTHAFHPDGRWLVIGTLFGLVELYDLEAKDLLSTRRLLQRYPSEVANLLFTPDGASLIVSHREGIDRWALENGRFVRAVSGGEAPPGGLPRDAAFSPDGNWLAGGCAQEGRCLYRVVKATDSLKLEPAVQVHDSLVLSMVFTADSRWLITGGNDRTARMWPLSDARTDETAHVLRGHEAQLLRIATSRDGRWLATTALDDAPRLWDLQAPEPASTGVPLPGHQFELVIPDLGGKLRGFYDVAFSSDSRFLATVDFAGIVRLWTLDLDTLVAKACRAAGRNLSLAEWEQAFRSLVPYRCTCPGLPPGSGGPSRCPAGEP